MANQTTAVERIEARGLRKREVSGQIAVGTHTLQIGSVHGGIVNVAVLVEQPRARARSVPISFDRGRFRPFWIAPKKAQRRFARSKMDSQSRFLGSQE